MAKRKKWLVLEGDEGSKGVDSKSLDEMLKSLNIKTIKNYDINKISRNLAMFCC